MAILSILCLVLALFVHGLMAIYDFAYFRIPNLLVVILFVLFFFWAPLTMEWSEIGVNIIVFFVVLALSFTFFAFKWIGGGDAKYLAVGALWVGLHHIADYFLWVALSGGVFSVFYLICKDWVSSLSDRVWAGLQKCESSFPPLKFVWHMSGEGAQAGPQRAIAQKSIPYGVAIALGSWIILLGRIYQ
ncbi:Type IV prepilin peptidase [Candidatus Bealeia paramacronuclearis]|uniref:Type IV prepilin peptidase n=1 Tax=Candidatus Bealeia paramacronuclearis TaxID=1921001 RepID=A0ABZ2C3F2_9PROT|nr:Type IV prepilin peptidase [Candidatus Bealeia paramacronuclearis]